MNKTIKICLNCKVEVSLTDVFCGWCGNKISTEEDFVAVSAKPVGELDRLKDPDKLARDVYEYWVGVMKDCGFEQDVDTWANLDPEIRECFVEAIDENVVAPLERSLESMEKKTELTVEPIDLPHFDERRYFDESRFILCYYCGKQGSLKNFACEPCRSS